MDLTLVPLPGCFIFHFYEASSDLIFFNGPQRYVIRLSLNSRSQNFSQILELRGRVLSFFKVSAHGYLCLKVLRRVLVLDPY
jgi:hypothetical protein